MGNQLNMLGVWLGGCVLRCTCHRHIILEKH